MSFTSKLLILLACVFTVFFNLVFAFLIRGTTIDKLFGIAGLVGYSFVILEVIQLKGAEKEKTK